jgi:hypothetical protein
MPSLAIWPRDEDIILPSLSFIKRLLLATLCISVSINLAVAQSGAASSHETAVITNHAI